MEEKNPIQVSERIFQVIEYLAQHGPMGLSDLSRGLSLNKSTVHRILNSLICMDYVKQEALTLKYSLSFKFCRISNQILAHSSVLTIARPYLEKLSGETGETVHLVQRDGVNAVYIDKVESSHSSIRLVSMIGKSIPLYCSGVGKALLADMADTEVWQIWEKSSVRKLTENTVTDPEKFYELLTQVRRDGYATDNEEIEKGVRCIAVSLTGCGESPSYAVSISAPKDRMDSGQIPRFRDLILHVKKQLQLEMGQKR